MNYSNFVLNLKIKNKTASQQLGDALSRHPSRGLGSPHILVIVPAHTAKGNEVTEQVELRHTRVEDDNREGDQYPVLCDASNLHCQSGTFPMSRKTDALSANATPAFDKM
jgi:hypothetical protein